MPDVTEKQYKESFFFPSVSKLIDTLHFGMKALCLLLLTVKTAEATQAEINVNAAFKIKIVLSTDQI